MESVSSKVQKLCSLDLSHDVPSSASEPISLNYNGNLNSNFADSSAFALGLSKFWEEAKMIRSAYKIYQEGFDVHSSTLYSWRSVNAPFLTIPDDHPQRSEMYEIMVDILGKEINHLFDFYKFVMSSKTEFLDFVKHVAKPDSQYETISDGVLRGLGRMLDMFKVLDDLRGAKTSVKNDFSAFKRIKSLSKNKMFDAETSEIVRCMADFLSGINHIMNSIKAGLKLIPDSYKVIASIIGWACEYIENRYFISPQQRHAPHRIILACLSLLNEEKNLGSKLEQLKIPFSRIDKVIREASTFPLIGDMHSNATLILKKLNLNYEWKLADPTFAAKLNASCNICLCLETFQNEHISIFAEYALIVNSDKIKETAGGIYELSPQNATTLYNFALKALRLMGKWNYALQDTFFYKLSHPADEKLLPDDIKPVDSYSLATKYNYSPREKSTISRIMYFVKSLSDLMKSNETLFINAISMHIYNRWQEFSNTTLLSISKKADKSKNTIFKTMIWGIRTVACDRVDSGDTKSKKGDPKITIRSKSVAPLFSQVYMVTTMVAALLTMKDTKKHIDIAHQQQITQFLSDTVFFEPLCDFSKTVFECAQMSLFWFKEFYIEMSSGNHIQYPIDDSFPWIITDHMINSNECNMHDIILRNTTIYDDAASYALTVLKRCHLFDEIDAEASLVYQQLCYLTSTRIFNIIRSQAFTHLISKSLKNNILKKLLTVNKSFLGEMTIPYHSGSQISSLFKQRSIRYLGRTIDLKALTSQRLLISMRTSIEGILTYMEANGLEQIVLVKALIEVYQETHQILSKNYDLPPFNIMMNDINGSIPGYMSRITNHIVNCIRENIATNYSYCMLTSRFVKSPVVFGDQVKSEPPRMPKDVFCSKPIANAFEDIYSIYSKYVGIEHLEVAFKLIGYAGVSNLVGEIKKDIFTLIDDKLKGYTSVLIKGMPAKNIIPRASYTFAGAVKYYEINLEGILKYSDLREGALHCLRVFGNYMVLVYLLEKAVYSFEGRAIYLTSPLNGIVSCNISTDDSKSTDVVSQLMDFYKYLNIDALPISSTNERFRTMIRKANVLNNEKLCCGLSFFSALLEQLAEKFNTPFWHGAEPANGVVGIEECTDFHFVFSAINYCSVVMQSSSTLPIEYEFGDGLQFAGISIIIILNQYSRFEALDFNTRIIQISESNRGLQSSVSYSSATLKSSTSRKTLRTSETSKTQETSPNEKKTLSRMQNQVEKRHMIWHILNSSQSRRSSPPPEVVKCFHPPIFQKPEA